MKIKVKHFSPKSVEVLMDDEKIGFHVNLIVSNAVAKQLEAKLYALHGLD
jgi:hypothetical protein